MLYGPPGTGKTLLARAVAHHTDCTFIRVSGSELVQKYIGEGSRMVRELFVMARLVSSDIEFWGIICDPFYGVHLLMLYVTENTLHPLSSWMKLIALDQLVWNLEVEMAIVKFSELCWSFSINSMALKHLIR